MSVDTTKLSALVGRAVTDQERTRLVEALKAGNANEELARLLGVQARAEDPPAQPNTATAQTATAELTDQEADLLVAKLWPRFEAKFASQQQNAEQAATKAAEPTVKALETVSQDVTTVKADVAAIKATLDGLTGQQSAGERYRASQAADTVVGKADDDQDESQETYAERLARQRAERMQQQQS